MVLVAALVSCGLDAKIKKLNKAAMKGKTEKATKIFAKIIDKYDNEYEWTPAQVEAVKASLDSLKHFSTYEDYKKCENQISDLKKKLDKIDGEKNE